jgi:hypothetical protein
MISNFPVSLRHLYNSLHNNGTKAKAKRTEWQTLQRVDILDSNIKDSNIINKINCKENRYMQSLMQVRENRRNRINLTH